MAELATYWVELGTGSAAVWAHNGHVARQFEGARKTLGQHLSEKFGDSYYSIAFLSYSGEARAWDQAGKIGVIPHALSPTPDYNVEAAIMNATSSSMLPGCRWDPRMTRFESGCRCLDSCANSVQPIARSIPRRSVYSPRRSRRWLSSGGPPHRRRLRPAFAR